MPSQPYCPFPNQFRTALKSGRRAIGCWTSLANPFTTEILGLAGFDWLLLDGEHSPNDVTTFIPQLNALKDSVSAPVVRPPWNEPVIIKRLLDIGFFNFLIPFVESGEEAARAVASTRYPPAGIRGFSVAHRMNKYGTLPNYMAGINDNITVLVQVESRKGVDAIDEIAAVDGVDGVFVGPGDLSAALGYLGRPGEPEVQKTIKYLFERIQAAGKAVGILAPAEADARRYLEWGATFVAVGSDLGAFRSATQGLRDKYMDVT